MEATALIPQEVRAGQLVRFVPPAGKNRITVLVSNGGEYDGIGILAHRAYRTDDGRITITSADHHDYFVPAAARLEVI